MLKFIGLLMIIISGAALGARASAALKKNAELCISVRTFLSELGILMKYSGDTLFTLFTELYERQSVKKLLFLDILLGELVTGKEFPCAWRNAISADKTLTAELSGILLSLGDCLGTSGIEGQLMSLERTQAELEAVYEDAINLYRIKGKLYRSMGLLGGITAALLLC